MKSGWDNCLFIPIIAFIGAIVVVLWWWLH